MVEGAEAKKERVNRRTRLLTLTFIFLLLLGLSSPFLPDFLPNVPLVRAESGSELIAGLGAADYYVVVPNATTYALNSDGSTLTSNTNAATVIAAVNTAISGSKKVTLCTLNGTTLSIASQISFSKANTYWNFTSANVTVATTGTTIALRATATNVTFVGGRTIDDTSSDPLNPTYEISNTSANGGYIEGSGTPYYAFRTDSTNTTIDGFDISGFGVSSATGGGGIVCSAGSSNVTIQNNNIHDMLDANYITEINILEGSGDNVNHNILDITFTGVLISGDATDGHHTIEYNEFKDWHNSLLGHAIYIDGSDGENGYNEVAYNYFHDGTVGNAIYLKTSHNLAHDNLIKNVNTVSAPSISLFGELSYYATNDNEIYNNRIQGCNLGFWLRAGAGVAVGNLIHNNTFYNVTTAIKFSVNTGYIQNNKFYQNNITTCTTVFSSEGTPSSIQNTQIYDNNFNGLSVGSTVMTFSNTTCWNNTNMAGYYHLNATSVGSGTVNPDGLGWQYYSGQQANITWTPNVGYSRQDLSLDGANQSTTTSPYLLAMNGNHSVITYFSSSSDTYTLALNIENPQAITYTNSSIPVTLAVTGNDTSPVYSWNVKFTNGTWLYGSNQTGTDTTITIIENATDALFACVVEGYNGAYDYGEVTFSVTLTSNYPVTISITYPANTTYTTSTVPVTFTTSTNGTLDVEWWNLKNGTDWVYPTNQTYSGATEMTGLANGTSYGFYAWANNTEGYSGTSNVNFSVTVTITYTLTLLILNPEAVTYSTASVPVSLSTSGNDTGTAYSWNFQYANGTWLYESNQTDSSATMTINENCTGTFACTVTGSNGTYDYGEISLTVLLNGGGPASALSDSERVTSQFYTNAYLAFGLISIGLVAAAFIVVGNSLKNNPDSMPTGGVVFLIGSIALMVVGFFIISWFEAYVTTPIFLFFGG